MQKQNNIKVDNDTLKIRVNTPSLKKIAIILGISLGVMFTLLVLANEFFKDNYLEFRSPLQSPILIKQREVKEVIKEVEEVAQVEEVEEVAQVEKPRVTSVASNNTLKLMDKRSAVVEKLMAEFGDEWVYVVELLGRESSLNHKAINPTSGACGLFQAYPCEKMGCDLSDIDCQIAWGKNYIEQRYGTPSKALAFHTSKGWY